MRTVTPRQLAARSIRNPVILLLVLFYCLPAAVEGGQTDRPGSDDRPNIIFILADDQSPWSIGAYGNKVCQTPNLDRLAANGMRFDGAYHMGAFQGAVCTASRYMIMSGRTLWHIPKTKTREQIQFHIKKMNGARTEGNRTFENPNVPEALEINTIAAVFNRAGYDTMRTCKKGNSFQAANQQFSIVKEKSCRGGKQDESSWHADQVLGYLSQRLESGDEDPFMIYFGFSHPHDPRYASDELLAKYGAVNVLEPGMEVNQDSPALPANYLPAHPFHHGHPGLRDEVKVQGVMELRDEATIRNEKGREYACIEYMDTQIGRVIKQLEDSGELENTYIIFTSDHGIAVGRHGLMGKQNLYEHTWRVPYIVSGPGIAQGSSAQGNIYLLDTLATICDLAGIDVPKTNEGISFKPVLDGQAETVRDVLYGAYCGGTKPGMRCVRKGDWKLIRYETLDGAVRETQLFNLASNPEELLDEHHDPELIEMTGFTPEAVQTDLAEDPQYANVREEMEALLLSEMVRLDDPYRFDEGYINPPRGRKNK